MSSRRPGSHADNTSSIWLSNLVYQVLVPATLRPASAFTTLVAPTPQSNFSFAHGVAVARIVSGCSGAFQRCLARPPTRRRSRTARSNVLSEATQRHRRRSRPSHVAMQDIMSPLIASSSTVELCNLSGRCCLQRCCNWSMCAMQARSDRSHRARSVEAGAAPRAEHMLTAVDQYGLAATPQKSNGDAAHLHTSHHSTFRAQQRARHPEQVAGGCPPRTG